MQTRSRPGTKVVSVVMLATALVMFSLPLYGADGQDWTSEPGRHKTNAAAAEKLSQMDPREIASLDALMAHALTLYYDRKFALALPIFKELADKVETMDIMFWLGTSAAKTGENELAVDKFKQMLAIDPNLHRVRLELAAVYFTMGRYQEARTELKILETVNPPAKVKDNIARMMAAIDESMRKIFWNVRLDAGHMWDDNISSGPDPGVYTLPGGSAFQPAPTAAKLSDEAFVAAFAGNMLYDIGKKDGLLWNTAATVYSKSYYEYSQFNYLAVDINTGPWYAQTRNSIFKLPVGYTNTKYGSERLTYILHVDPSYEYFFNPFFSLKGTYTYKDERYFQDNLAAQFDNRAHIVDLAPTFYLGNRRHIITARLGYDHHTAKSHLYTYYAPLAGLSHFTRFPTLTEVYLGYQWTQRDYARTQGFPYSGLERHDKRHYATAVLSQAFYKYFNLSYEFAYTDNNSNLDLYRWDKTTHTIRLGCRF